MTNSAVTSAMVHLASYAVSALWQIPLLFAAGWLAARVVRRLSPAAEHNVWELTLLFCVLLPALPAPHSSGHAVSMEIQEARVHRSVSVQNGANLAWRGPLWIPVAAVEAICGLWMLTVLFAAIRLAVAMRRTRQLIAAASPCTLPEHVEPIWQDCLHRFGIHNARVLSSRSIAGPMTIQIDGHALLLPEGFADAINPIDFAAAAAHECAHMQRHDFRSNLAYRLLALPVAFHPALRLVQSRLVASREIACDRAAAETVGNAITYRDALLRLATWMAVHPPTQTLAMGAAVGIFDSNSLEERMERLSIPAGTNGISTHIALTTAAVVLLTATAFAAAAGSIRLAPLVHAASVPQAQTESSGTVYKIGGDVTTPHLTYAIDPQQPDEIRAMGTFHGESLIGLVVDEQGLPQDVHVIKSLGKGYDDNALAAVRQYRFKPAMRHGQPVSVALTVSVNYQHY